MRWIKAAFSIIGGKWILLPGAVSGTLLLLERYMSGLSAVPAVWLIVAAPIVFWIVGGALKKVAQLEGRLEHHPRSNMPIKDALKYICNDSSWAYEQSAETLLYGAAADLRLRAINERVQVWGRPEIKGSQQRPEFSSAELPITKTHWYKFELNLEQIYEPRLFRAQTNPENPNDISAGEIIRYDQLRVDSRQIHREWRRATISQRVRRWVGRQFDRGSNGAR